MVGLTSFLQQPTSVVWNAPAVPDVRLHLTIAVCWHVTITTPWHWSLLAASRLLMASSVFFVYSSHFNAGYQMSMIIRVSSHIAMETRLRHVFHCFKLTTVSLLYVVVNYVYAKRSSYLNRMDFTWGAGSRSVEVEGFACWKPFRNLRCLWTKTYAINSIADITHVFPVHSSAKWFPYIIECIARHVWLAS